MITKHSKLRTKQRAGFKGKTGEALIKKAYERGLGVNEASPQRRRYLENVQAKNGCTAKVYAGCCFVFMEGTCVTVLKLPKSVSGKKFYSKKEKVRNIKKCMRYQYI